MSVDALVLCWCMDARRNYLDSTDAVAELISRGPEYRLGQPALGVWDLRALIGHTSRALTTVVTYLQMPRTTVTCADGVAYYVYVADTPGQDEAIAARGEESGRALGRDVAAAFATLAREARDALERYAAQGDPVVPTLAGGMRLSEYLPTRTFELIVHGYDIARAAEISFAPHPQVVADTAALAARVGVALGHGPRLVPALTGRGWWRDTSVFARAPESAASNPGERQSPRGPREIARSFTLRGAVIRSGKTRFAHRADPVQASPPPRRSGSPV